MISNDDACSNLDAFIHATTELHTTLTTRQWSSSRFDQQQGSFDELSSDKAVSCQEVEVGIQC